MAAAGARPVSLRYGKPVDLQAYYQRPDSKENAEAIVKEIMGAIAALMYNGRPATNEPFRAEHPISERGIRR